MPPTPNPSDLSLVLDGARIANAMPYIEHAIKEMERLLIARTLGRLKDMTLTPEAALLAWQELASGRTLLARLDKGARIGQSAGERVAPHMEGDEVDA